MYMFRVMLLKRVTNLAVSRTVLERPATEGDSPVRENCPNSSYCFLSTHGPDYPWRIRAYYGPRLNTFGDR